MQVLVNTHATEGNMHAANGTCMLLRVHACN